MIKYPCRYLSFKEEEMSKKSKKKSNFGAYFQILLWMIVGGVCGFLFIKYSENYLADAKLSIKLLSASFLIIKC